MANSLSKSPRRLVSVLFASTAGSARAPIAEAILLWLTRSGVFARSAGIAPAKEIHPLVHDAVRRAFNGRIEVDRPRSIPADAHFDYVITLSPDAAERCSADASETLHWPIEDPTAVPGTRIQQRQAFDRVTRDLLKRLRGWWKAQLRTSVASPAVARSRPHLRAKWRTQAGPSEPLLLVAHYGPMRSCVNMCGTLERSGFHVVCGDRYGRTQDALPFSPDGVVVRVDGRAGRGLRFEFVAMKTFRRLLHATPILVLVDHAPSRAEREAASACDATLLRRGPQATARVVETLRAAATLHRQVCLVLTGGLSCLVQ